MGFLEQDIYVFFPTNMLPLDVTWGPQADVVTVYFKLACGEKCVVCTLVWHPPIPDPWICTLLGTIRPGDTMWCDCRPHTLKTVCSDSSKWIHPPPVPLARSRMQMRSFPSKEAANVKRPLFSILLPPLMPTSSRFQKLLQVSSACVHLNEEWLAGYDICTLWYRILW